MRLIISLVGCILTINATAQEVKNQQYIKLTYMPDRVYVEQAVDVIAAVSTVQAKSTVTYLAGKAIELLPGFQAKPGSVFTAHIQEVVDGNVQLTAFPNPFDQSTTIDYTLPENGKISLFVVDVNGKVVEQLVESSQQTAGRHQIEWSTKTLSPGVYMPVLQTQRQRISKRILKK